MTKKAFGWESVLPDIGARFKEIRIALDMNQEEFSRELNLTRSTISLLETGKNGPGLDTLYRLAAKYDINLNFLLLGKGPRSFSKVEGTVIDGVSVSLNDQDREFLAYYFASPIVRLETLSKFNKIMSLDDKLIKKDIERNAKGEKPKG